MLRKASLLTALLVLVAAALFGIHRMSLPTVTVGSGMVTPVQNGAIAIGITNPFTPTLPVPSTPGTALLLTVFGLQLTAGPSAGWTRLVTVTEAGLNVTFEAWIYLNNPGGIQAVPMSGPSSGTTDAHLSEWANVASASALETSGTATAAAGTTLTPAAANAIVNSGDLVIAAWAQLIAAIGAVTFTTPTGFTRLKDNGSLASVNGHDDIEYLIGPSVGTVMLPRLTSTGTSISAAGAVIVLKANTPTLDISAFLEYGSLLAKLNTFDFGLMLGGKWLLEDGSGFYLLEDGSGDYLLDTYVPKLGDPVTVYYPSSP